MQSILLVDDDTEYLRQLRNFLVREGISVHCAENGEIAIAMMQSISIDLMITDLNMPGLNGFELALKSQELAPHIPIIMSTGDISPEISQIAAESGITAVLSKPFHPHELLEAVKMELGNAQLHALQAH